MKRITVLIAVVFGLAALGASLTVGHVCTATQRISDERLTAAAATVAQLEERNAELRDKLVSLSDEYHALLDEERGCNEPAWHDIGECTITHYCSCTRCCGKCDGITASGAPCEMGRTVAVDPDVIPLGSEVLLNGVIYTAMDVGVHGNAVDIYIDSHEQALQMGVYRANVCWR